MFLEVGVWGETPHIALLLFVEKQKGRFLEVPLCKYQYVVTLEDSKGGCILSDCANARF